MNRITNYKLLIVIILLLFLPLNSQDANLLEPMDIFEMEGVSNPQMSPDGSKILYVRSGSDIMTDKRYSNI